MLADHRVIAEPAPASHAPESHQPANLAPASDPAFGARPRMAALRPGHGLDDREVHAIAVGRADAFRFGWSAVVPRSRLARWIATLTGTRGATPFADVKLEALRLFACVMRRDDRRIDEHAATLIAHGYTPAALHQAISLALA